MGFLFCSVAYEQGERINIELTEGEDGALIWIVANTMAGLANKKWNCPLYLKVAIILGELAIILSQAANIALEATNIDSWVADISKKVANKISSFINITPNQTELDDILWKRRISYLNWWLKTICFFVAKFIYGNVIHFPQSIHNPQKWRIKTHYKGENLDNEIKSTYITTLRKKNYFTQRAESCIL